MIRDKDIKDILSRYDVVYKRLPKGLFGYVDWENGRIVINSIYDGYFQRITEMHEILHIYYNEHNIDKTEEEIDYEARSLVR